MGLLPGALITERNVRIGAWSTVMRRGDYSNGVFRSVYPLNYLNRSHLDRLIDGLRLEEWVFLASAGTIEPLADNLWTWTIHDPEKVTAIRDEFDAKGLTVSA